MMSAYRDKLIEEINAWPERLTLKTIFLGGGTPSYLPKEDMALIVEAIKAKFELSPDLEFTMEVNPGNEKLHDSGSVVEWAFYTNLGINRISLGVQSFDDSILKKLGRIHTSSDVSIAVNSLKSAGFENFSLDLMYGLPNQTLEILEETLAQAIALNPKHISAYSLIIEPHTPFEAEERRGMLPLPEESLERSMALLVQQKLAGAGYQQYEISNFAQTGFESRHNKTYWHNEPYLGLGSAAHSFWDRRRFSNPVLIKDYLGLAFPQHLAYYHSETLALEEEISETLFLGLRVINPGLEHNRFYQRYGVTPEEIYPAVFDKHVGLGLLQKDETSWSLSPKGLSLGNEVFADFVDLSF
jgi:putative oxygen-independent coproporphyrinogen III oxidase